MSAAGIPTLAERVDGSPGLARRRRAVRAVGAALGRIELCGVDRLPTEGPVVVAVNHRSALDGPLLFGLLPRPVNFLVKVEAFVGPLGPALRANAQIPVRRQVVDRAAVRMCLDVLRAGGVVGIFPEGARGDGLVRTARPGMAYLAMRSGAAMVPVACHGTDRMTHRRSARRPVARVVVGSAVPVERHPDDAVLTKKLVAVETERLRGVLAHLVADTATGEVAA